MLFRSWSHTDSLTCDTCHNSWQLQCLGCHVGMDMRLDQTDYQTGAKTPGLTTGSRSWFSLDTLILCENEEGRAQSCHSSQQVQLSVTDFDGNLVIGDEELGGVFRQNDDYHDITGWSPFDQHTTSSRPRTCSSCHRQDESPEELERVRGVYGSAPASSCSPTPRAPTWTPSSSWTPTATRSPILFMKGLGHCLMKSGTGPSGWCCSERGDLVPVGLPVHRPPG